MPGTRRRTRRSTRPAEDHQEFTSRLAIERAKGAENAGTVIGMLESRLRDVQADNFDYRTRNRELRDENKRLTDSAAKPPDGKVIVDAKEWDAASAAHKALTTLGVDVKTLEQEYPKGRDALLDASARDVAKAEGITDQGFAVLKRVAKDHKLALTTQTVKDGDKDVVRAYVVVEGKQVPVREHLKAVMAELEPAIYAGASTTKTPPAGDQTRRMPPTGSTTRSNVATPAPDAVREAIERGRKSVLARYSPPEQKAAASA
jgi:hypothetical protein